MAESNRIITHPDLPDAGKIAAEELTLWDGTEYCTLYRGSLSDLVNAGVATIDQFPTGVDADNKWTKSGGFAGWKNNPSQRWKVRKCGPMRGDQFEVLRWHEERPTQPAFERFMREALRPLAT